MRFKLPPNENGWRRGTQERLAHQEPSAGRRTVEGMTLPVEAASVWPDLSVPFCGNRALIQWLYWCALLHDVMCTVQCFCRLNVTL